MPAHDLLPRTCGACTACCVVHGVVALQKPERHACEHLGAGGCAIYARRPGECAEYSCLWLSDGVGEEDDRPDALGVILDHPTLVREHPHYREIPVVCAKEVWAGAFSAPRAAQVIGRLAAALVVRLTDAHGRTRVSGPRHLVEELVRRADSERAGEQR